jgi:ABC-type sugar transport system ATPase subunit
MPAAEAAFRVADVHKRFGRVHVLRGVSVSGRAGEILGLAGANGAGKSTLMRILSGLHPVGSYGGRVEVCGAPLEARSMRDAEAAGVVLVPQELASVPDMTVAENVFLNHEPRTFGIVRSHVMNERAVEALRRLDADIAPDTPVRALGMAARQTVEIAKALHKQARVLLLDEPTSSLTAREVEPGCASSPRPVSASSTSPTGSRSCSRSATASPSCATATSCSTSARAASTSRR